jgi:2,4-dienoyl-CoA reductase-like NADH-dependent reductase (Old Yellow Enzyme family)
MAELFEGSELGPIRLKNRFLKAATFEGRARRGVVSDELIEFHRVMAAGGIAMTTVAYLAVSSDGRTDRHCILLSEDSLPGLARLTKAVHDEGALVSAQIGHAGPVANARSNNAPSLAPSSGFSAMGARLHEVTTAQLDRIVNDYAASSALAKEAGFDCIEIHMGHNYLISSFLSPKLNRRKDEYGGSLENRARLARRVARAVREAVGPDIAVIAKLNLDDGVPGGFGVSEAAEVASWLETDGAINALELTGGSSLANPMYLFRGDAPREEFAKTLPQPLRLGFKVVGKHFMPSYPFEEAYFIDQARVVLNQVSLPVILLGGITKPATAQSALNEGFSFFALGRPLLMEPSIVRRWERGDEAPSACTHCNKCMPTIYEGTHCVLNGGPLGVSLAD